MRSAKEWSWTHTICKHKLKMNQRPRVGAKIIKLLEESMAKSPWPWLWQKILRYMTPKAWAAQEKIDNLGLKLKTCASKDGTKGEKATHRMGEMFINYISDKDLEFSVYKGLL